MEIVTEKDQSLEYETNSLPRKVFNFFFVPILNRLPAGSDKFIKKSHKSVNEVVENVTTHYALEVLYNKGYPKHSSSIIRKVMRSIWFNTDNSKSVRNRLLLVKRELRRSMDILTADGKDISILSIASGSARAVIESINELTPVAGQKISAVFLDKNPHALEYSKQLAQEYSLINRKDFSLSWINGTAETFLNSLKQNEFNVIEMVGLLDYFNDAKAVSVFSRVHHILDASGLFITANICDNSERVFMTRTIQWNMIYRSAEDLGNLLKKAGFSDGEIRLYYEPLHVHVVAAVTKK